MTRQPRRSSRGRLPTCLATLVAPEQLHVGFVQGVSCSGHRAKGPKGQVSLRSSQQGQQEADPEEKARRLTSGIKKAYSAGKLMKILDEAIDDPIFDFFHASAAYTKLVTLKRRKGLLQREWDSPVLLRLHARVEDMMLKDQLDAQASANILWTIAQLSDRFSVPTQLLGALVKSLPAKVKGMKPQELANCLWACAKLKDLAPIVLEMVPAIVAQIPKKAKDMKPQELSNSLWASGQLKDVAPDVLDVVPAIVMQIPNQAQDMVPQALSNCLYACMELKDEVRKVLEIVPAIVREIPVKLQDMKPQEMSNSLQALAFLGDSIPDEGSGPRTDDSTENIVRSAAGRFKSLLPRLTGKDLTIAVPVAIWACARVGLYDEEFLASVAKHFGSDKRKLSALPNFSLCALSWSYQVFSAQNDFNKFDKLLMSKARKRGFDEADVQSCQRGHLRWNHGKL